MLLNVLIKGTSILQNDCIHFYVHYNANKNITLDAAVIGFHEPRLHLHWIKNNLSTKFNYKEQYLYISDYY
jgi:hypothetical protein